MKDSYANLRHKLFVAAILIVLGMMVITNASAQGSQISLVEISAEDLRIMNAEDSYYIALLSDVPNGTKTAIYMYDFNNGVEMYGKHRQKMFDDQYILFMMPRSVFDDYTVGWYGELGTAEFPIVYNNGIHATLFMNHTDEFGYIEHGFLDVDETNYLITFFDE